MGLDTKIYLLAVSEVDAPFSHCGILCYLDSDERDRAADFFMSEGFLVSCDFHYIDKDLL